MQFKHPELLYALFLLVIPIIIHLFQLRRFQKIPFTNVKFLKEVELQTRKSSKLKKFLILCSRLLLFAALIIAFAQPFIAASEVESPTQTSIYLDNSYSMQAKGNEGELLKRAVQDIIENTQNVGNINLYTNNNVYKNLTSKALKNTLLEIEYHPITTEVSSILFKIQKDIQKSKKVSNVFLISDFQQHTTKNNSKLDTTNTYYIAQTLPENISNVGIDSVYISDQNNASIQLTAIVKNYGNATESSAISLYNNEVLSGKSTLNLAKDASEKITFNIPNSDIFNGKLHLDDENIAFDNSLYFTIDKPEKINITAVGTDNTFLSKIYTNDEFNYTSTNLSNLDYNSLNNQHLLLLNEVENISGPLTNALNEFTNSGGSLVIIPPLNANINKYNTLLSSLKIGNILGVEKSEVAITTIEFSHPLLKGVFEKQIQNFQYPTVKSRYRSNFKRFSSIIDFEDGKPFISQSTSNTGKVYWVSAPISGENSNFKNSPLIVPVFYNFGLYSTTTSQLYYSIGKKNNIEIPIKVSKDGVLHLTNATEDYIPLQQIQPDKVIISTEETPLKSGFYEVMHNESMVKNIAYNFDRIESKINYRQVENYFGVAKNITFSTNVKEAFINLYDNTKITNYWQWFLIAALFFLIIEILLLKFL